MTGHRTSARNVLLSLSIVAIANQGCQLDDGALDQATFTGQALRADGPDHDQRSVLVKFRDTPGPSAFQDALALVEGKIQDSNHDRKDDRFAQIAGGRLALVDLGGGWTVGQAIERLARHPAIEYVEPNYTVYLSVVPNDPSFGNLWGLHNTGQAGGTAGADIQAVDAWNATTGSAEIVVGIVDTGIDYTHPDLAANMWRNPGEVAGNGVDDDGNGYIDDIHGINTIAGSGDPMDDHDHGSHCAGTIGAVGGNGVGVAGVSWNVSMVGLKFLSAAGSGSTADAIEAINYAVALKNRGVNLRVLNNSWGGGGFSQALQDAIATANNAGILFVAAAGNNAGNNDSTPHYPSSYDVPNVLAVASTTRTDAISSFSNYGASSVDMGAPGSEILSTTTGNAYAVFSGTSMATPHVAGAAALVLSFNHALTVAELKDILISSGDPISALAGWTVSGKRLNVASAVALAGPPQPRFDLAVSPASRAINQGQSTSYTVDIASVAGFSDIVTLSVSSSPALAASLSFTSNSVAPGSSPTLDVVTTTATATGTYILTVTGTSGSLVLSTTATLTIRPEGTTVRNHTNTTRVNIPDSAPVGITSSITVPDGMIVWDLTATVNITHPYIGDLLVTLRSPNGTQIPLHNRAGGPTDNLYQSFPLSSFNGQDAAGVWVLSVSDRAGGNVGALDSWSLSITGVPTDDPPPTADYTVTSSGQTASFTDTSTVNNGAIIAWSWDFGDGGTSTLQNPTHTYAATGSYIVTLDVTDNRGATAEAWRIITVGSITRTFTNTTPANIPDNKAAGILSTINVPDSLSISQLSVTVNITHTRIGDLKVRLTSPTGATVLLHDRTGGSADDLHQTYTLTNFNGQLSAGVWTLKVSDHARKELGRLDNWSMTITAAP
jgi:subtilisin-like proprotein convertase family protein/subtilisin family serine protease